MRPDAPSFVPSFAAADAAASSRADGSSQNNRDQEQSSGQASKAARNRARRARKKQRQAEQQQQQEQQEQRQSQENQAIDRDNQEDDNAGAGDAKQKAGRKNRRNKRTQRKGVGAKLRASIESGHFDDNDESASRVEALRESGYSGLAAQMISRLQRDAYECLICFDRVRRHQAIWPCKTCFTLIHIGCISKWARRSLADDADAAAQAGPLAWRCPGCQSAYVERPKASCFCGAHNGPAADDGFLLPHSCGEPCKLKERLRDEGVPDVCEHPCAQLCHPGPCAPCSALGPLRSCYCGQTDYRAQCSDERNTRGSSCGNVCDAPLDCGNHRCSRVCHPGGQCRVNQLLANTVVLQLRRFLICFLVCCRSARCLPGSKLALLLLWRECAKVSLRHRQHCGGQRAPRRPRADRIAERGGESCGSERRVVRTRVLVRRPVWRFAVVRRASVRTAVPRWRVHAVSAFAERCDALSVRQGASWHWRSEFKRQCRADGWAVSRTVRAHQAHIVPGRNSDLRSNLRQTTAVW